MKTHSLDGPTDVEAQPKSSPSEPAHPVVDIEHVKVTDDPRLWPRHQKGLVLSIIAFAAIAPTLSVNLYNPAFKQIEEQLHASSSDISLSLSLFILVQGNAPLFWSAVSEIKGRKIVYFISLMIFAVGSIVAARSQKISVLIGMRILQAAGSSAVLTVGAGTMADMYDSHERGSMMGIYYATPLLGPAVGPIIGGLLTLAYSWRATFWFLVIFACISLISFIFLRETWRRERSLAYQSAIKRARAAHAAKKSKEDGKNVSHVTTPVTENSPEPTENNVLELRRLASSTTGAASATVSQPLCPKESISQNTDLIPVPVPQPHGVPQEPPLLEKVSISKGLSPAPQLPSITGAEVEDIKVKVTLADVNIVGSAWQVVKRRSNLVTLLASGLLFAFQYGICYTCARTFAKDPYNLNPTTIGLVLLSFGIGNVAGSVLGGRWSDRVLRKLRAANGGVSTPEMRLRSTVLAMGVLPPSTLAYAWMCEKHVHVAGPVVALFFAGFSAIWIYSSTLAYIVDANTGRSSTAVATNSSVRGLMGLVIAEVSAPLQDAIGDGGLYTIWAGLVVVLDLLLLVVMYKGTAWRVREQERERERRERKELKRRTDNEELART